MEIEITRKVEQKEVINIDFPYYYKYDVDDEYSWTTIYGKVDVGIVTSLWVKESGKDINFELDIVRGVQYYNRWSHLFDDKYKCTKEIFDKEMNNLISFANKSVQ